MNTADATRIANFISQAWPNAKIQSVAWIEPLAPLEFANAGQTFRWLRDHSRFAPSIAEFLDQYRAMHGARVDTSTPCDDCNGIGWRSFKANRPGYGEYDAAEPCHCLNGHRLQRSIDTYAAEL